MIVEDDNGDDNANDNHRQIVPSQTLGSIYDQVVAITIAR